MVIVILVIYANLRTYLMDFRGFDSIIILILRGGILMSIGNFPESSSQAILVGIMLVGRLGVVVHGSCAPFASSHVQPSASYHMQPFASSNVQPCPITSASAHVRVTIVIFCEFPCPITSASSHVQPCAPTCRPFVFSPQRPQAAGDGTAAWRPHRG